MANPNKAKGTAAETAVVQYLRDNGFRFAERRALNGNTDLGDVTGIPGAVIEVKNQRTINLAAWVDELRAEMKNAGAEVGFLVVKRRGKTNPADWYWVTVGPVATTLLGDWWATE